MELRDPSGESKGFSAYYDGHHYRFRNRRLQEYHLDWDSVPFTAGGGVQATAQFTDLYPAYIAESLKKMGAAPDYSLSISGGKVFDGRKAVEVKSVYTVNGQVAAEKTYIFDASSMLPLRIDTESNPGSISEQSVLVTYSYPAEMHCPQLSEEALMKKYPEVFEKYRENNFRIENLPGSPLPTFSLPTTTGERYTYHSGDRFAVPTVIVMLDPSRRLQQRDS